MNIKHVLMVAAVFSFGIVFGATGINNASAWKAKTYKTEAYYAGVPGLVMTMNELAKEGWVYVDYATDGRSGQNGYLIVSK